MATQLLALGTAAATSADFTLAAGDVAHIHLRGSSPPAVPQGTVSIDVKGDDNSYTEVHRLTERNVACVIDAPGAYRVRRGVSTASIGVDRD
jgi:hypothetical protein